MKKQLLLFLFAIVASVGTMFANGTKIGDLYYNLNATNKTAEVTYKSYAYSYNEGWNITTANIPASVTYRGTTYSVTSIGRNAFYSCTGLTSVKIGNSVTTIGGSAFGGCSGLTSVKIGNSVTSIGDGAFGGCSGLTSVTIPNSVTTIGGSAFAGCSGLTSVTIPNSVTSIGEEAFYGLRGLTSVTIGNSVTSIGYEAFALCSSLTSVTIPNSVTSIGWDAFYGCSSLTSVTIGNSVTSIGDGAFANCSSLTSINVADDNPNYSSKDGVLFDKQQKTLIQCPGGKQGAYVIPNSVTRIGNYAFYKCSGLTSVTIPNSVTSIGESAFAGCSGLTSVTIPNSVTSIGGGAFAGCSSLTSVTIPNSVTSIGENAFYNCRSLTSVTIPNSVTRIENSAFYGVSNIMYNGTATGSPWGAKCLNGYVEGYLVFSDESKANIVSCSASAIEIVIPNSVTSIGNNAFSHCSSLTSVTLNSNAIVSKEYDGNSNIVNIFGSQVKEYIIGESVTSIGEYAFYGCSSLTSVTIGNSVTSMGSGAFYECSGLTSVTIGNSVTSIGDNAFYYCTGLTSIEIPNSVTSIGKYAFHQCSSLTSVTIGNSVTSIGGWAFSDCSSLTAIYVPCGEMERFKKLLNNDNRVKYEPVPYTITIYATNGSVAYPQTTCDDMQLTATPYNGYHFVKWSDGNTDNPRTIELTCDTIFTALFEHNQCTLSLQCDENQGTVEGAGVFDYLAEVQISATPAYGYHFLSWSDGNTANPRTITVTKDVALTANFALNKYALNVSCNAEQGSVSGSGSYNYLSNRTIEAIPNYGYHFAQWSDGNKENPRTIVLTQDTAFAAEFAVDKSGVCGDDNLLTWTFEDESKTLAISGEGTLNSNYTFGVEAPTQTERLIIAEGVTSVGNNAFKDMSSTITSLALPSTVTEIGDYAFAGMNNRKFNTLVLPNTIIRIGAHAFDGASYLQTIHFGSTLEEIGDYAFNGCTRVKQMTCLAEITPNVGTDGLTSINSLAELYVPNEYLFDYQIDSNWSRFVLKPYGATETTVTDNDVAVVADDNTATFTWPTSNTADSYTIDITKDGVLFCQLTFNANGQLTGIAFAPGRDGQSMAPAATLTTSGMQFTVTGLNSGTNYAFNLTVKSGSTVVASYTGAFATTGGVPTSTVVLQSNHAPRKFIRDNQVLILRNGKTYTIQGVEVK